MIVTHSEVQGWIDASKLPVEVVDGALHDTARDQVYGLLSRDYDTTTWVDALTTPSLVRKIIAMLIAAWTYRKVYSESSDQDSWYANKLERRALKLIDNILDGTIVLIGVTPLTSSDTPGFYPTDTTGTLPTYDSSGYEVAGVGGEDIKFHIGSVF